MSKKVRDKIYIYTDGGCRPNPGIGAAASILVFNGKIQEEVVNVKKNTTNNEMEIAAFVQGLLLLLKFYQPYQLRPIRVDIKGLEKPKIILFCDSQYVVKGVNEWMAGWKSRGWRRQNGTPIMNQDMWRVIDEIMIEFKQLIPGLVIKHIKAHSGKRYNEYVDNLCTQAITGL
jgi:ribonuclease HI